MRLFFDANILTYIAIFEGYLCEATILNDAINRWTRLQNSHPDRKVLDEVEALRMLYLMDEQSHFDWLFSDIALQEIEKIREKTRKESHYDLLDRLIEHRNDVYAIQGEAFAIHIKREPLRQMLFPNLSRKMTNDALQFCEAILVEADFFLTNDNQFIKKAPQSTTTIASTVSNLPFIKKILIARS